MRLSGPVRPRTRFLKNSWFLAVVGVTAALGSAPSSARADPLKRDLFRLGTLLGRACQGSVYSSKSIAEYPGALTAIERELSQAAELGRSIGNPMNSTLTLRSQLFELSFAQIDARLGSIMDEVQRQYVDVENYLASSLFAMGIWVGGAECIATLQQGYGREVRPGSAALIRRNLTWLQEQLSTGAYGLTSGPLDRLIADLDRGAGFPALLSSIVSVEEDWLGELAAQPPFAAPSPGAVESGEDPTSDTLGPCDQTCDEYCKRLGQRSGRLAEGAICILGEVSGSLERACACRNR